MLLKMLVLFAYDNDARDLQQAYGDTLHLVHSSLTEIWPTKPEETNSPVCSLCFYFYFKKNTV